ncbi:MAG: methyltransferase domain-containing protein [Chloroflexi bacterium]|nr:methyltransferase domain-containing protein [Chloroflexota bacterium]
MMLKRLFSRQPRTLNSRRAYAQWAKHYPAEAHNAFMRLEQSTMAAWLPDLRGKIVLDLACGTGRWGNIAAEKGAAQVISLDNSYHMLVAGKLTLAAQAELSALPLPASSVDMVICGLAIGHTPHLEETISEIARILKPGGVTLLSDVHPYQAWQGAKRTFKGDDGKTYAVEHHIHNYADYFNAAKSADLTVTGIAESGIEDSQPPVLLVVRLENERVRPDYR